MTDEIIELTDFEGVSTAIVNTEKAIKEHEKNRMKRYLIEAWNVDTRQGGLECFDAQDLVELKALMQVCRVNINQYSFKILAVEEIEE